MSDVVTSLNAALEGRDEIERRLGEGAMASVCLAEDLRHRRKVALKVLLPELAAVLGSDRFLAEIQTTAQLQHPHILPLFDSGEADGLGAWRQSPPDHNVHVGSTSPGSSRCYRTYASR